MSKYEKGNEITDMWREIRRERQEKKIQSNRLPHAKKKLEEMGFVMHYEDRYQLHFKYKGSTVIFWPYTGWHSGKSIKDGRGFQKLLKQLK